MIYSLPRLYSDVSSKVLIGRRVNIDTFMFRLTEINVKTTNLKKRIGLANTVLKL